jgi:hypothetical protein
MINAQCQEGKEEDQEREKRRGGEDPISKTRLAEDRLVLSLVGRAQNE